MQAGDILRIDGDTVTKIGSTLIGGVDNLKDHLAQYRHVTKRQNEIHEQIKKVLPDTSVLEYWNFLQWGPNERYHLPANHLTFWNAYPNVKVDLDLTVEDPTGILCTLTRTWQNDDVESSDFTLPFEWLLNKEKVQANLIAAYNQRQQIEEQKKLEERRQELLKKKQAIETELASIPS